MSLGMSNMVKQHAIIRKLSALESLGGITDICTDKTGTLTEGRMSVHTLWIDQESHKVGDDAIFVDNKKIAELSAEENADREKLSKPLTIVLKTCSLCNSSRLSISEPQKSTGDPTEVALNLLVSHLSMSKEALEDDEYEAIENYPFDTDLKRSSVVYREKKNGQVSVFDELI
jgi:Na+-exporting ATPase